MSKYKILIDPKEILVDPKVLEYHPKFNKPKPEINFNKEIKRTKKNKLLVKIIFSAVNRHLSGREKQCFLLYYSQGKRICDIAAELGLTWSPVKTYLERSIKKIKGDFNIQKIDKEWTK